MIIDGTAIAQDIRREIKEKVAHFSGRKPTLAVIQVGDHPASRLYIQRKIKACEEVGIHSVYRHLSSSISEEELLKEIEAYNVNPTIDGILVQLPLPQQINSTRVTRWIDPDKDVDGFHPLNVGKMLIGESDGFLPCTPLGIKVLLDRSGVEVEGKHAVILGRSNIVGKPMAALLMQNTPGNNATVTLIHRHTKNIKELCLQADILIVAIGNPLYVKADMVKKGAIVIDVGINKLGEEAGGTKKIVGDVDFDNVKEKCALITPVPGGVGPMTIAMLLSNTLRSYSKRLGHLT